MHPHLIALIAAHAAHRGPFGQNGFWMTPLEGEVLIAVLLLLAVSAVIGLVAKTVSNGTGVR